MVQRYTQQFEDYGVVRDDGGEYVSYDDYRKLEAELTKVKLHNEMYVAEMSEAKKAGFYCAQELFSAYTTLLEKQKTSNANEMNVGQPEQLRKWLELTGDYESVVIPGAKLHQVGDLIDSLTVKLDKMQRARDELIETVEMLCRGLEWNIDEYPDIMDGSDCEALDAAKEVVNRLKP